MRGAYADGLIVSASPRSGSASASGADCARATRSLKSCCCTSAYRVREISGAFECDTTEPYNSYARRR